MAQKYFSNRVAKFDPEHVKERVRFFLRPVEEKGDEYMECAAKAVNSVILEYGVDKGRELGYVEANEQALLRERDMVHAAIEGSFGECPAELD